MTAQRQDFEICLGFSNPVTERDMSRNGSGAIDPQQGSYRCCRRGSMNLPWWAVPLTLLLVFIIAGVLAATLGSKGCPRNTGSKGCPRNTIEKCRPCLEGWVWYAGNCYFFSDKKMSWASSQEYCATYNGTLAILKSKQDMEIVERFKDNNHWVGLIKTQDAWEWLDGSILPKDRFPSTNNDSSLSCAYLNYEAFGALHCKTKRHCLCTRAAFSCFMAPE